MAALLVRRVPTVWQLSQAGWSHSGSVMLATMYAKPPSTAMTAAVRALGGSMRRNLCMGGDMTAEIQLCSGHRRGRRSSRRSSHGNGTAYTCLMFLNSVYVSLRGAQEESAKQAARRAGVSSRLPTAPHSALIGLPPVRSYQTRQTS